MELVPPTKEIGLGGQLRVNVIATYTDGSRETVTDDVEWATSAAGVLLPSATNRGYLVTFGQGNATVTATLEGKSATGEYVVGPARIDYLVVSPQNARIDATHPVQYSVMGHWSDGRYEDVSSTATWTSSDPAIATISATGLATVAGDGAVVITAKIGEVEGVATARTVGELPVPRRRRHQHRLQHGDAAGVLARRGGRGRREERLQLGDRYCEATHPVVIFVVVAGWCPHCPEYMRMVNARRTRTWRRRAPRWCT